MEENVNVWSPTGVSLGKHGDKALNRPGFVNQNGLVALPPKKAKNQGPWFKKMEIGEESQRAFSKMS